MKEKRCKDCWWPRGHNNALISRCKECTYKKQSEKPVKTYEIKKTPVAKMWKKRAERIKKEGSEWKVFVEIWFERVDQDWKRICDNCWKHIKFFHSSCFAHKLNKRDNPKLRYVKENIALVHWIFEVSEEKTWKTYDCHKEWDLKYKQIIKNMKT